MHSWKAFQDKLNYWLVISTSIIFASVGSIFLYATLFIWYKLRLNPNWESSWQYLDYVSTMNIIASVPASILVILLIICLQRRSTAIYTASVYTGITLLIPLASLIAGYEKFAVAVITVGASIYQFALLIRLILKKEVLSEKRCKIEKAGSLILHIGYSLIIFSWVPLNGTKHEIPIFWLATIIVLLGTILSFYGSTIFKLYSQK